MYKFFITEIDKCEKLWKSYFIPKNISDLWDFRICFNNHYSFKPCFLVIEEKGIIVGILPLSYVEERDMFAFFPGEIWEGKTWMERTPYFARNRRIFRALLKACPERTLLRYLEPPAGGIFPEMGVDENGYVLYPGALNFDESGYEQLFSRKKYKAIKKVIESFYSKNHSFHVNRLTDFDLMVEMNVDQFRERSYLFDPRFRESFRDVMHFLYRENMLRMISIEIEGRIAAVDIGAVYSGTYTVFLGGTDRDFPGIAKLMNMYHINYAFTEKMDKIDFLCGDFHWKKLWHLEPEQLYIFESPSLLSEIIDSKLREIDSSNLHQSSSISLN